jgi:hypothetical protein
MKNIQKNKKSWLKGLVVAGVFAISVLNLSIDSRRDAEGNINLSLISSKAKADGGEAGGNMTWFWKGEKRSCSWTHQITVGVPPLEYSYGETTDGTKTICVDGPTLCWSTRCR